MIGFFFCAYKIYATIGLYLGDLYDERKEGTQTQISTHAVGSDGYHARDLADVRPEMQHGDASILTKNTKRTKLHALCTYVPLILCAFVPL